MTTTSYAIIVVVASTRLNTFRQIVIETFTAISCNPCPFEKCHYEAGVSDYEEETKVNEVKNMYASLDQSNEKMEFPKVKMKTCIPEKEKTTFYCLLNNKVE